MASRRLTRRRACGSPIAASANGRWWSANAPRPLVSRRVRCNSAVMKLPILFAALLAAVPAVAAPDAASKDDPPPPPGHAYFTPSEVRSTGSVATRSGRVSYQAIAGTLVVHSKGWSDTDPIEAAVDGAQNKSDDDKPKAEAAMYLTAYFKTGPPAPGRPVTLLFNGGARPPPPWVVQG